MGKTEPLKVQEWVIVETHNPFLHPVRCRNGSSRGKNDAQKVQEWVIVARFLLKFSKNRPLKEPISAPDDPFLHVIRFKITHR
nr:MAG TPA: hypothetical protein [Caudoviricetes sp.]